MSLLEDLNESVKRFQDELLEDAQKFETALKAFRKTRAKPGSDRYYELYGQLYAAVTQLQSSASATEEIMDRYDDLEDVLDNQKVA